MPARGMQGRRTSCVVASLSLRCSRLRARSRRAHQHQIVGRINIRWSAKSNSNRAGVAGQQFANNRTCRNSAARICRCSGSHQCAAANTDIPSTFHPGSDAPEHPSVPANYTASTSRSGVGHNPGPPVRDSFEGQRLSDARRASGSRLHTGRGFPQCGGGSDLQVRLQLVGAQRPRGSEPNGIRGVWNCGAHSGRIRGGSPRASGVGRQQRHRELVARSS